jgi:acetyl-CoA C-acetyltransferase
VLRAAADTIASGSSPQYFINKFGEEIARGKRQCVLIAGGEVLMSSKKMGAMGKRMKAEDADEVHALLAEWHDDTGAPPPEMVAAEDPVMKAMGAAPIEAAHGLGTPVATYPIFEQALRRNLGHSLREHQDHIARICHEMTEVAALPENVEHAWFPEVQSAESIKEPTPDNRYIGFPYTTLNSTSHHASACSH